MEIKHKNLKEDFKLLVYLGADYAGEQFKLTFSSRDYGRKTYVCSYDGTSYTNCEMADSKHVLCKFDNHGLPCGMLVCEIQICVPDTSMFDGNFRLNTKELVVFVDGDKNYHLEIVDGKSDTINTPEATFELLGTVLKGATGVGEKGEKGDKGDDGKSAFEIAVENGYTGTEEEWLTSLKGKDGKDGKDGEWGGFIYPTFTLSRDNMHLFCNVPNSASDMDVHLERPSGHLILNV